MNTLKKNRGMLFPVGVFVLVLLIALVSGCNKESKGFALPAGDLEAGKATFEALNCNACHSIADIQWKGQDEELRLPLGGETTRIKTYGELVTSVINPSHKISDTGNEALVDSAGNSKMKVYNDVITVQELVDLVTFLQSEYKIIVPEQQYYYPHY
jgi:sulfur-oxidizing protein SoxX